MAAEGKQSRLTVKNIAFTGVGIFLTSWAIPKALDHYLDTTLLTTIYGWLQGLLLGVWSWLTQEQPQPNWFPVGLVTVILLIACVFLYTFRLYSSTLKELNLELASKASPTTPKLATTQHLTLMRLASLFEGGEMLGSITNFGVGPFFNSLDKELALGQLESMGFVEFTHTASVTPSRRKPVLTLKGMEYVSAHRKASAEKKQQNAKDATPVS